MCCWENRSCLPARISSSSIFSGAASQWQKPHRPGPIFSMKQQCYLAVDLGAESGRVIAGLWNGRSLRLEEVHRFPNGPVEIGGSLRWDVLRLWAEIQNGLTMAGRKYGKAIQS